MNWEMFENQLNAITECKDIWKGRALLDSIKAIDIAQISEEFIKKIIRFDYDMFFEAFINTKKDRNEECLMFYSDHTEYCLEELIRRKGYEELASNGETVEMLIDIQNIFDLSYKACEAANITKQILNYNDLSDDQIAERELKGIMNYMTYYSFINFTDEEREKYTKLYAEYFNQ